MDVVKPKATKTAQQNIPSFHPEVQQRIAEMESLNRESQLAGRGAFDKVFGDPRTQDNVRDTNGSLIFSFIKSGYQTTDITVLDQHSVVLKIKAKSNNARRFSECSKKVQLFECTECDFKCRWNNIMIRHIRKTHSKGVLYVCAYCEFYCVLKPKYDAHMLDNHKDSLAIYSCDYCDFTATLKCYYERHMVQHTREKHTGEQGSSCHLCSYNTTNKQYLKRHMFKHTGEKAFGCHICSYSTSQKCNLDRHMQVHRHKKA